MSHPAIAIIKSGDTTKAIEYLKRLDDPRTIGAVAMLENGFKDYATWILEDLPPHVVSRAPEVVG